MVAIIFCGVAGLFVFLSLRAWFHQRWVHRLPSREALNAPTRSDDVARVSCSVVIAARDEESRIEQTVIRLLAQQGVELEIIVVDDRSTDKTGEIVRKLAEQDSRVRLRRIDSLPEGWLGKCHACHVGASIGTGDWILFTDADCWLKPDVLARALSIAQRNNIDHIALTPGLATPSLGTQAWHLAFLISMANWISGVNRDKPRAYFGLGAFNLVRASAYSECGGYEKLRMTVLDDVKLGLLLRRAGKRTRGFIGGDDVECHWGSTVGSMIRVTEKNYFAAIDFRWGVALGASSVGTMLLCVAVAGPFTGTVAGLAAGIAPWSFILPAWSFAKKLGWPPGTAVLTPCMFPVLLLAMLNSVFVTLGRGGVRWRDTFYAIDVLRKGALR